METPFSFVMVLLLCNQIISMGMSPLWTVQVNDAVSPELTASSPKSNGRICGRAIKQSKIPPTQLLNFKGLNRLS